MQKVYIWASVILHHRTHAATSFLVLTITSFFENSEPLKAYIELRICQLKCSIHCSIILPWFFVRWKTLNSKILVSSFDEMKTIHIIYSHGNNKNFYTFFLFLDFFNYQSKWCVLNKLHYPKMEQYAALKIAWRAVKIPFFKKGYFFLKTNVQIYVVFKCNRKLRIAWFKVISIWDDLK